MIVDYINLIIFYIQHLNQFQSEYQQSHFHSKSVFIIRLIHWIRFSFTLYLTGRWYEVLFLLQPWLQDGIALAFRQFNTTGTASLEIPTQNTSLQTSWIQNSHLLNEHRMHHSIQSSDSSIPNIHHILDVSISSYWLHY